MNLKEGALLHNNTYRIERVLGQGGFGITYLAVHVRLKKKVAIKEFFPKAFCDRDADTSHVRTASKANSVTVEKLKKKFIKEAEHIAEMDSPYIVRIIDVFEENHTAYYIMDYIEGRSLSDIVKSNGPLPVDQAVEYITKIGEALTYIHSKRMNHLDVKPANIMVRSKDNTPILIDFGLSKQYDSEGNQTSTTPVGISHGYAPMEQYNDGGVKEFSPQTDLYSLAATLYFLLSGFVPPQATKLIEDELTFPTSIPTNLIMPISKAMSSKRTNRHETINQFIRDINSSRIKEETEIPEQTFTTKDDTKPNLNPIINTKKKHIKFIGGIIIIVVFFLIFFAVHKCTRGNSAINIEIDEMLGKLADMDSAYVDLNDATLKQINSENVNGRGIDVFFTASNSNEFSHLLPDDSIFWHMDEFSYAPSIWQASGNSIMTFDSYEHCVDNKNQPLAIKVDGKWGFCNARGDVLIPAQYEEVKPFVNGFAAVYKDDKWGYINTDGSMIIPIEYYGAGSSAESAELNKKIAIVADKTQYFLIDEKGNRINDINFEAAGAWGGKDKLLCPVEINGKWGYIDNNGIVVITPRYEEANDFMELSTYATVKENGKWGVIGENAEYVLLPQFNEEYGPTIINGKLLSSKINDKYVLYDIKSGNVIGEYDGNTSSIGGKYVRVQVNDKYGILNNEGRVIVIPIYTKIKINGNLAHIALNGKSGYFNLETKKGTGFIYDWADGIATATNIGTVQVNDSIKYVWFHEYDGQLYTKTFDKYHDAIIVHAQKICAFSKD